MAPAYDIISTTAYIENDIPALHLLGSKKWWDKKYLLIFAIEQYELNNKQAEELYDECVSAIERVLVEIKERLLIETNENKINLLKHFLKIEVLN